MDVWYIFLGGYILTAILHGSGIWLLYSVKIALVNQRLIILNLAMAELLSCIERIVYSCGRLGKYRNIYWLRFGFFLYLFTALITKFIMFHLTLDRFLEIYLHMKYAVYLTKTRLVKILATLWILSASVSITLVVISITITDVITMYSHFFYIYFGIDITITFTALVTYMYFFIKIRSFTKCERQLSGHLKESKRDTSTSKKFLVPCLTIASYILFNVTGTTIQMAMQFMNTKRPTDVIIILSNSAFLLTLLGWIADWIIYILLQRKIRKVLMKKCCADHSGSKSRRGTISETCDEIPSLNRQNVELKVLISKPSPERATLAEKNSSD